MKVIIASIIAAIAIGAAIVAYSYPQVSEAQDAHQPMSVLQIDVNNVFARFGTPGFFKLLADYTDMEVVEGHVAISNVNCRNDGSPFVVVLANANVGAGNTDMTIIPLDKSNLVDDVSFPGRYCTYHVDIHGEESEFLITDIALANSDSTKAWRPHQTASATIHAHVMEIEVENGH